MHDATKVLMGSTVMSKGPVTCFNSDPATFLAGLAVRQSSTVGELILAKASGSWAGVSLGKSLSDTTKTDVLRTGLGVPMLATLKRATGVITVSSYANLLTTTPDVVTVAGTAFAAQSGAATPGDATFRAATDNAATAVSLAAQINAHATVSLKVYAVVTSSGVVTLYSVVPGVGSTGTGNDIGLTYTDNGGGNIGITLSGLSSNKLSGGSDAISDIAYIAKGAKAYINDVTGMVDIAMSGFSTVSDAMFISEEITGINESAVEVAAVLVDMQGGL